ncbi:MAG: hypothetical protein KYX62_02540 [Pseudomonadota bacterium]|nr:hypothetical protein [Pseudomonadota bacterium]
MTLHLLFSADPQVLNKVRSLTAAGDRIMLAGDGVYLAPSCSAADENIASRETDLRRRGLIPGHTTALSDSDWVKLTVTADNTLSWF